MVKMQSIFSKLKILWDFKLMAGIQPARFLSILRNCRAISGTPKIPKEFFSE